MLVRDSFERHADFRMLDCSHLEETCVRVEDGTESSSWLHSLLVSRGIARQVRHALGGDLSRVTLPRATRPTSSPYYNKASDPNYYLLVAHSYEPLRTVCSTAEAAWYTAWLAMARHGRSPIRAASVLTTVTQPAAALHPATRRDL